MNIYNNMCSALCILVLKLHSLLSYYVEVFSINTKSENNCERQRSCRIKGRKQNLIEPIMLKSAPSKPTKPSLSYQVTFRESN